MNDKHMDWNEKLFEAMLGVAIEESVIQEMADLPSREELDAMYPPSIAFDKKIKAIIAKEEWGFRRKRLLTNLMKVVAYIGIFFTIGTFVLLSVEASRTFILNTIISMREDHVAFEFVNDEHSHREKTKSYLTVSNM